MKKKELKIAGIVTLYNPTDKDISNINTYIDDIDILYVIDNTEGEDNKKRIYYDARRHVLNVGSCIL